MENLPNKIHSDNQFQSEQNFRMGDALVAHAKLKPEDIERILVLQKDKNLLFGEAAQQLGLIKEDDLKKILAQQFDYPYAHDENQLLSPSLIAAHAPFSPEVEKIRSLRGQLLIRWFDQGNKTLAITSAGTDDGASLVAANLAIVFSQMSKKTLLIDANLRQPSLHSLFNIQSKLGLSNILGNRQGSYQVTRLEYLPNLHILPAGTEVPNPQELLNKSTFSELLADLENAYDIILIDTSPFNLGADLLTVVSKANATIIVTRKDYTMVADMQQLQEHLAMTSAKILGSVIQEY